MNKWYPSGRERPPFRPRTIFIGYENEFISYGSDGYIDDDSGEYMESNDAGWDYSDEYYDDYDPWSDPGDGWDDYSYDDEGWGDYFDE